jgi:hypothetical protein
MNAPKSVTLRYRHPETGEEATWTVPVPCSPKLMKRIEDAFAARGFVRVEDPEPPA